MPAHCGAACDLFVSLCCRHERLVRAGSVEEPDGLRGRHVGALRRLQLLVSLRAAARRLCGAAVHGPGGLPQHRFLQRAIPVHRPGRFPAPARASPAAAAGAADQKPPAAYQTITATSRPVCRLPAAAPPAGSRAVTAAARGHKRTTTAAAATPSTAVWAAASQPGSPSSPGTAASAAADPSAAYAAQPSAALPATKPPASLPTPATPSQPASSVAASPASIAASTFAVPSAAVSTSPSAAVSASPFATPAEPSPAVGGLGGCNCSDRAGHPHRCAGPRRHSSSDQLPNRASAGPRAGGSDRGNSRACSAACSFTSACYSVGAAACPGASADANTGGRDAGPRICSACWRAGADAAAGA